MDATLKRQLEESLYIHYPLKADESRMLKHKPALCAQSLWDGESGDVWRTEGRGRADFARGEIRLTTMTRETFWQANEKQDGTYATFGDFTAFLDISGYQLGAFSQLAFDVFPECEGTHSPMLRVGYTNEGASRIPDEYGREGFHAISLKNNQWNRCVWDISQLPHDAMKTVLFRMHKYGEDTSAGAGELGSEMRFSIRHIRMERIETPNVTKGWQCERGTMVYSTSGYWTRGAKTAILNPGGEDVARFSLIDRRTGETVFTGPVERVRNARGTFDVLDFSAFDRPGEYSLRAGEIESEPFPIEEHVLESAVWKLINFLFCERCGYPVPGKHGVCHGDVLAHKDGRSLVFNGGWHDAADVSQQTTQSAELTDVLMELAERVEEPALRARLMEEARWGLDFVLRTSFGGGYHASNVIMRRYTDNLIG
ncbi:MAG: cellulase N-terminal Ig-like domain-containing protein, partial [Clostridia bacterium]|nr:cellulase N-terminal Ig-like domain-containing protein [Clostridia bacterium]